MEVQGTGIVISELSITLIGSAHFAILFRKAGIDFKIKVYELIDGGTSKSEAPLFTIPFKAFPANDHLECEKIHRHPLQNIDLIEQFTDAVAQLYEDKEHPIHKDFPEALDDILFNISVPLRGRLIKELDEDK